MKKSAPLTALAAAAIGFIAGYALQPAPHSSARPQSENFSLVPSALAQEKKPEVMPFNYNSPREPALAPDAPPTMYWSVDDLRKAHSELAEVAAKAIKEAGTGSSQSFGGGPIHVSSRNFSIFKLYRLHCEQPVARLTKVKRVWDGADQLAGGIAFYVITGGTREMVRGGEIANTD